MGAKVVATVFIPIFAGFVSFIAIYILAIICEFFGYHPGINPFSSSCDGFLQIVFWLVWVILSYLGEMAIWSDKLLMGFSFDWMAAKSQLLEFLIKLL